MPQVILKLKYLGDSVQRWRRTEEAWDRFGNGTSVQRTEGGGQSRLNNLRAIADQSEATPSQVAIAWVLAKGAFVIPGTKRLAYLEQNIAAASFRPSADDIAKLDQA